MCPCFGGFQISPTRALAALPSPLPSLPSTPSLPPLLLALDPLQGVVGALHGFLPPFVLGGIAQGSQLRGDEGGVRAKSACVRGCVPRTSAEPERRGRGLSNGVVGAGILGFGDAHYTRTRTITYTSRMHTCTCIHAHTHMHMHTCTCTHAQLAWRACAYDCVLCGRPKISSLRVPGESEEQKSDVHASRGAVGALSFREMQMFVMKLFHHHICIFFG